MKLRILHFSSLTSYNAVWELQKTLLKQIANGDADILIYNEHKPVVTIGRSGKDNNLLSSTELLRDNGIELVHTDRGGDITYHGPGQLVLYPIFNLNRHYLDIHKFLRDLENVTMKLLTYYDIESFQVPGRTGVWTKKGKIAAIGIAVRKWVTMHGLAFNFAKGLHGFNHIIPCGIADAGVTSLEELIGERVSRSNLAELFTNGIQNVFNYNEIEHLNEADFEEIFSESLTDS